MRIRPGLSNIFPYCKVISIRQLLFHLFCWFLQLCCWKHPQNEKYCDKPEQRPIVICPYFIATWWLRGQRSCTPDVEQRKEVWTRHAVEQIFTCCLHITCSLCHSSDTSWLRVLPLPCLTGRRLPPERGAETLPLSIKLHSGVWISDTY